MRKKVLEQKQLEMAKIVQELNNQIDYRDNLIATEEKARYTLENEYMVGEINIDQISNYKHYLAQLTLDIKKAEEKINNIKKIVKIKQAEVQEAYKQVKILEKLKEKQEKEFYTTVDKMFDKEIDDLAITRYESGR
ncbi:flagellar export protein FliJ [bacterium]|nr:flagellar export protein FliJ [bacterium]